MKQEDIEWLKRGRQKSAVAQALYRPMTPSEIRNACLSMVPSIQLRDIWSILRQLIQRRMAQCLTPGELTGKVFALTAHGRMAAVAGLGVTMPATPTGLNWHLYAYVARAKARRAVFLEICRSGLDNTPGKTASAVKKALKGQSPMTLDAVRRATKELHAAGLIEETGRTVARNLRLLGPTAVGRALSAVMTATEAR